MTTSITTTSRMSILESIGNRYQVDPSKVMSLLSATAFKQATNEPPLTPEEFQAALIVANQYELNPFTKEIFAFRSKGKLLTVVSVDGWCAIINRHLQLDGIEFTEQFKNDRIFSITCKIHRKDRGLPIVVTEYLSECQRDTEPWKKSPIRMLRHRALIQCSRVAFSVSGIVDEEEAELIGAPAHGRIIESTATQPSGSHDDKTIDRAKMRVFGEAWKNSGKTLEEVRKFLMVDLGVESSAKIRESQWIEALKWAETSSAVVLDPNMEPEERKVREAFRALAIPAADQRLLIDQYTEQDMIDWDGIADELSRRADAAAGEA